METNEPAPAEGRACLRCGGEIPSTKYRSAIYCSPQCRNNAASERWVKQNKQKRAATMRQSRKNNPETHKRVKENVKQKQQSKTPQGIRSYKLKMLNGARNRAKKSGIPFNLTVEDIHIPDLCPVLGTELLLGADFDRRDQAPSLDRVVPLLGYVKGNVMVISFRANRIKNDATVAELEQVAAFYKNHMSKNWMVTNDQT